MRTVRRPSDTYLFESCVRAHTQHTHSLITTLLGVRSVLARDEQPDMASHADEGAAARVARAPPPDDWRALLAHRTVSERRAAQIADSPIGGAPRRVTAIPFWFEF